jgi:transposase
MRVRSAGRPGQRFVPVRSIDNQAELMRHRARELLAGQRTAALNALRGHLAEIGLIAPQGEMAILVVEQYFEWARDIADNYVIMDRRAVVLSGARETMNEGEVRRWLTV